MLGDFLTLNPEFIERRQSNMAARRKQTAPPGFRRNRRRIEQPPEYSAELVIFSESPQIWAETLHVFRVGIEFVWRFSRDAFTPFPYYAYGPFYHPYTRVLTPLCV